MALPCAARKAITRQSRSLTPTCRALYLYNGRFTGVFSRLGPEPVISKEDRRDYCGDYLGGCGGWLKLFHNIAL